MLVGPFHLDYHHISDPAAAADLWMELQLCLSYNCVVVVVVAVAEEFVVAHVLMMFVTFVVDLSNSKCWAHCQHSRYCK